MNTNHGPGAPSTTGSATYSILLTWIVVVIPLARGVWQVAVKSTALFK